MSPSTRGRSPFPRSSRSDSSLNHVAGPVTSVVEVGNRVRVGIGALTAEITRGSADRLGVVEGAQLVASFKATATRLVPLAGARTPR